MPRSIIQTLTLAALGAAIVFVSHNFVTYVLRVNGGYSEWSQFSFCTKSCGKGTRFRIRVCNNPVPKFGGLNCSVLGAEKQTVQCNSFPCPVDGGYGPWSEYGSCSVTCGEGVQERKRKCDHPIPQFAGLRCDQLELGPDSETKSCKMENCPVDGGYGPWGAFSVCTVTCGGGTRERTRSCDNPKPEFGGKTCEGQGLGESVQTESCNVELPCPIDGGYTNWTEYTQCTVSCGGGTHQRSRDCTNPKPAHGGKNCEKLGSAMEIQECNTEACPSKPQDNQGKEEKAKESEKEKSEKKEEKKEESSKGDETKGKEEKTKEDKN
ncbi:coadhesin-like isoform X2 [Montipora capricornis]|uniref:coadhesin-like isoform X2 n=1 Tax=Montipora capricornis TaxID=246305 RepID=UPI0035F14F5A